MEPELTDLAWEEIELAERYLLKGMAEEAESISSSILQRLCNSLATDSMDDTVFGSMIESAGMVFVQSLKELGRVSNLLNEVKQIVGYTEAIPVNILIIGAILEISDGHSSHAASFLEEFLSKWKYMEGKYVVRNTKPVIPSLKIFNFSTLDIEDYVKVAEIYSVTLLGKVLGNTKLAMSWVEKAILPEERRQEIFKKIRSYHVADSCSLHDSITSQCLDTSQLGEKEDKTDTISGKEIATAHTQLSKADASKGSLLTSKSISVEHFFERGHLLFCLLRSFTFKFRNFGSLILGWRITLLSMPIFLVYYILWRKRFSLKQTAIKHATTVQRALIDLWKLGFSVQVNPLAAIQPLPIANGGTPR